VHDDCRSGLSELCVWRACDWLWRSGRDRGLKQRRVGELTRAPSIYVASSVSTPAHCDCKEDFGCMMDLSIKEMRR
jgi:hypothetical protein